MVVVPIVREHFHDTREEPLEAEGCCGEECPVEAMGFTFAKDGCRRAIPLLGAVRERIQICLYPGRGGEGPQETDVASGKGGSGERKRFHGQVFLSDESAWRL
jgi:hypothetical protein